MSHSVIGNPIGSDRGNPNRPRIAHIESCRVVPYFSKTKCVPHGVARGFGIGATR
jgi:hypothetical protein